MPYQNSRYIIYFYIILYYSTRLKVPRVKPWATSNVRLFRNDRSVCNFLIKKSAGRVCSKPEQYLLRIQTHHFNDNASCTYTVKTIPCCSTSYLYKNWDKLLFQCALTYLIVAWNEKHKNQSCFINI